MNTATSIFQSTVPTLSKLVNECDILFEEFFDNRYRFTPVHSYSIPKLSYPINISQDDKGVEFELAVVGRDKKDIKISIDDGILRMCYQKQTDKVDQDRKYIYRGITEKSFDFSFKLDPKLDTSKISASMDKGLLKIFIPYNSEKVYKLVAIS